MIISQLSLQKNKKKLPNRSTLANSGQKIRQSHESTSDFLLHISLHKRTKDIQNRAGQSV
jgi:hypothetical protein